MKDLGTNSPGVRLSSNGGPCTRLKSGTSWFDPKGRHMENGNGMFICGGTPLPDAEELPSICPKCKAETIYGYGLMGGGIGSYVVCNNCDFFAKQQDKEANGSESPTKNLQDPSNE